MKTKDCLKNNMTFRFAENMLFSKKDINALLLPVILETFLSYFIGLMDSVMVSSAGEAAVSAVSLVDAISLLFINVFAALANGGAVVAGQYLGKKDTENSRSSAEQMIMLLLGSSVIISAFLLFFQDSVIRFLYSSAEKAVRENCISYYHIVMMSIPFIALYNGGAALFRTIGDSSTPLKISVIMNGINIVGNAVLIYVFKMGVEGVAFPTLVSRGVAAVIIIIPLLKKKMPVSINGILYYRPKVKLISHILNIGVPNGIENGMFQFGKLILMTLVSTLPTAAITANAIGNTMGSLHCVIGLAANSALMAVISRCAGAGDYVQARWYTRYIVAKTYIWQGIVNIILAAATPLVLKIYHCSPEVASLAVPILLVHGLSSIILWPMAFMLNISMRSAGDSRYAMWIASISMWLCRVGGAYALVKLFNIGVIGVWIAWIIDWVFRIAFLLPRYLGHKWETKAIE